MSNVNDNNLDDLLRRAAEKYPLRTDSANWDKLVSDLEKDPSLILPPVNAEDKRRRRRFFWLFLLLPLAGVGYYTWHTMSGRAAVARHTVEQVGAGASEKTGVSQADGEQTGAAVKPTGQANVKAEQGHTGASAEQRGQADVPAGKRQAGVKVEQGAPAGVPAGQTGAAAKQGGQTSVKVEQGVPAGLTNVPAGKKNIPGAENKKANATAGQDLAGATTRQGGHAGGGNGGGRLTTKGGHVDGENEVVRGENLPALNEKKGAQTGTISEAKELTLASNNMRRVPMRGNVSVNIPVQPRTFPKDSAKKERQKHSFYVGITGSPDLSTVKFQSVKNAGARYGVLFGYTLNDRWSLETGVSYGRKKYFTDGEYFNKEGANAGPYVLKYIDQLKIQGSCDMWEIPLNVRYNLTTTGKMKWFATAGVSAYYMSREDYYCWGYWNGSPWGKGWPDMTPSRNKWSTNLDLSIGYEQKIGRIGNLRLEPYVRVPISGAGTGKLSIMSAGLNIGITRKLW